MKTKLIFWIPATFLIVLFTLFTYGAFPYSAPSGKTGNETFDDTATMTKNWTVDKTSTGQVSYTNGQTDYSKYVHQLSDPDTTPHAEFFKVKPVSGSTNCYLFSYALANGTGDTSMAVRYDGTQFEIRNMQTGTLQDITDLTMDNAWHDIKVTSDLEGNLNISVDGGTSVSLAWRVSGPEGDPRFFMWEELQGGTSSCTFLADDWVSVNGTKYPAEEGGSDTTAPHITAYSDQGSSCTNWNSDTSNPCSTSDTLPTLYFNTSESANCALGLSDSNYTTLGSSRNCTSGEGTTEHACTLTTQDELVYEDSTAYIGCKDLAGNENASSTSGALTLTVTGLEASGDSSIGLGVQNALLSGYTNYTNQQVYARDLSNNQDFGTFDWVAKKDSRAWAFNVVTKSEEHVQLFNLTPTLYVLEMSNITTSAITSKVEALINATK